MAYIIMFEATTSATTLHEESMEVCLLVYTPILPTFVTIGLGYVPFFFLLLCTYICTHCMCIQTYAYTKADGGAKHIYLYYMKCTPAGTIFCLRLMAGLITIFWVCVVVVILLLVLLVFLVDIFVVFFHILHNCLTSSDNNLNE